jgi:hypothetical protein
MFDIAINPMIFDSMLYIVSFVTILFVILELKSMK